MWCLGCWEGPSGRIARRIEKLTALAESDSAEPGEKASARRRLIEAFDALARLQEQRDEERLRAWEAEAAKQAAKANETKRVVPFELRRVRDFYFKVFGLRVPVRLALYPIAWAMVTLAKRTPTTQAFWCPLGLMLAIVCAWFVFKPNASAQSFVRAIAYCVWFALMGWLWAGFEAVVAGAGV